MKAAYKPNTKALNPLNQYYLDKFKLLKKDADQRGMKNQSSCHKKVVEALQKYPMPVLCREQAQQLQGIGDMLVNVFCDEMARREEDFKKQLSHAIFSYQEEKARDKS